MSSYIQKFFLLALITGLLFIRVLGHDFMQLDDTTHLDFNPYFQPVSLGHTAELWMKPYLIYMPVTWTVWAAAAAVSERPKEELGETKTQVPREFRFHPLPFHLINYLAHLASTLTLFSILFLLLGSEWAALFGALIFAVHPVQVEAVAWVSALKDSLATLFALLSIWSFLRYEKENSQRSYWLMIGTFVLGILSKPTMVVLPIVYFAIGSLLLRVPFKKLAKETIPLLVFSLLFGVLALGTQPNQKLHFIPPSAGMRPWVALDAITFYVGKLLWPHPLTIDYGRSPQVVLEGNGYLLTSAIAMLLGIGLLGFYKLRQGRYPLAAGIIFCTFLLPTLGLFPFFHQLISTVADRYAYASMLGVSLLAAWTFLTYAPGTTGKLFFSGLVLLLGSVSYSQLSLWKDAVTLLEHASTVNPTSWLSYNNLGAAYERKEDLDHALLNYRKAANLEPSAPIYNNIGSLELVRGNLPQSLEAFQNALALGPGNPINLYSVGLVYLNMGDSIKARHYIEEAIRKNPGFLPALTLLKNLNSQRQLAQFPKSSDK